MSYRRPAYLLQLFLFCALLVCGGATWLALQQPVLGGQWLLDESGRVTVALEPHLAVAMLPGAVVEKVSVAGREMELRPADFMEDPDFSGTYTAFNALLARQDALLQLVAQGATGGVRLHWHSADGSGAFKVQPRARTLGDLPGVFWFQLVVALCAFAIASWVYLLRTEEFAARMFFITGVMLFIAVVPAAIYSTRAFAMPGGLLRLLSALNHGGTAAFGCAFVAMFASYPQRLIALRHLLWLPLVFGLWFIADMLQLGEQMDHNSRLPLFLFLLLTVAVAGVQWQRSRGKALERAALRWFLLSNLIGAVLVGYNTVSSYLFGIGQPVSQAYSIGFFLIIYVGLALGLGRYRLFDMDAWSYRVFLWVAGSAVVLLLDAALLTAFGMGPQWSLGIALLIGGWLYFPLRQWLWSRLMAEHVPAMDALLPRLSEVAFIVAVDERESRWHDLLQSIYEPLELRPSEYTGVAAQVAAEGLVLDVPSGGGVAAQRLRHAGRGARLFSSRDVQTADTLVHLFNQLVAGREGFERGVAQERRRIGRDLHDNIGARLLKLIHHLRGTPSAEVAREAMKDLRTAIAAIDAPPIPLADALADWRAEAQQRCEAAGVQFYWCQPGELPQRTLAPRVKAMLESVLREAITNALKHAEPTQLEVVVEHTSSGLRLSIENDGRFGDPASWREGFGLRNMRGRLREFGGTLQVTANGATVLLVLELPDMEVK